MTGLVCTTWSSSDAFLLSDFLDVERQLGGEEDETKYGSYALSVIGEEKKDG